MTRVSVGEEIGNPLGFMLARNKRMSDSLQNPDILQGVVDLVESLDRVAERTGTDPSDVDGSDVTLMRGMDYLIHKPGA